MSLYNYLFGMNKDADILLGVIGMNMESFDRFRDIFLNKDGTIITVLTRLGGGNREYYQSTIDDIRNNPNYIKDYDDESDCTYAYFDFKVPDKYLKMCKSIAPKEKQLNLGEKFEKETQEAAIEGTEANKRMKNMANKMFNSTPTDTIFFI